MDLALSTTDLLMAGLAFVAGLVVTSAIVVAFLVLIDPDHFAARRADRGHRIASAPARIAYRVGKNLLGAALVLAGIALSLPGVPGQGLLTVLVGLMLLDVPGKRRLERRLVARPTIRRAIDRIRKRFGRPPLTD